MNSKINLFIKDNGKMVKDMVRVFNIGMMAPSMKDIGKIIWQMVKED